MRLVALLMVICLSGCTIEMVDHRIPPEELQLAFKQRDAALVEIAKAVKILREGKVDKVPEKK